MYPIYIFTWREKQLNRGPYATVDLTDTLVEHGNLLLVKLFQDAVLLLAKLIS